MRDQELVLFTVPQALGLRATGDQTFLAVLGTFLREKRCLLVLDNFEQVISAAPQLLDLLESCPHVKLLVYLLYHCGLRPAEIVALYPQEWRDVQEIIRLRPIILILLQSTH